MGKKRAKGRFNGSTSVEVKVRKLNRESMMGWMGGVEDRTPTCVSHARK